MNHSVEEVFMEWEDECAVLLQEKKYAEVISMTEEYLKRVPVPLTESDEAFHMIEGVATLLFELEEYDKGLDWCHRMLESDFEKIGRFDNGHREYLLAIGLYETGETERAFENFCVSYDKSSGRCFRLPFYPHIDAVKYQNFHRDTLKKRS